MMDQMPVILYGAYAYSTNSNVYIKYDLFGLVAVLQQSSKQHIIISLGQVISCCSKTCLACNVFVYSNTLEANRRL